MEFLRFFAINRSLSIVPRAEIRASPRKILRINPNINCVGWGTHSFRNPGRSF